MLASSRHESCKDSSSLLVDRCSLIEGERRATFLRPTTNEQRMRSTVFAAFLFLACSREATPLPATVSAPSDPALQHHDIRLDQLPAPFASQSAGNPPRVVKQPADAKLHLPPGFHVSVFAAGLDDPRTLLQAPNGDVLVAEPGAGRILLLRGEPRFTYANNLNEPFGLALHAGYLYVGNQDAVVRFPSTPGDTQAR